MNAQPTLTLSPLETRVLGVLSEKQLTTPDYYPLTLNALVAGCNQKTSRHPVMSVTEGEVQMALDALKRQNLVMDSFGSSGRVMRFAHNINKVLGLSQPHVALLTVLMLRGPQTPGELRINCERMYSFPDISSVEAYLEELAGRHGLAMQLPKQPGSREHRFAQLLCGAPETPPESADIRAGDPDVTTGEIVALKNNLASLRNEVSELRVLVDRVYGELGLNRDA